MSGIHEKNAHSALAQSLAEQARDFVEKRIIPNEAAISAGGEVAELIHTQLIDEARKAGLWGVFYPLSHGGKLSSLEDYLIVAEQEGRTEFSQSIFGSHSSLDAHMMLKHGNATIQKNFLEPMAAGKAISSYAMTEPDHGGSFPSLISSTAKLENGHWVINARKWFVCNTAQAAFATVLVRTATDEKTPISKALSMILVPTSSDGFKVEREISMLGRDLGQGEMSFTNVKVPQENLIGTEGGGIALMGERLGIGRLLRAMHWLGLAQRCFDLMGARVHSPRGISARLPEKQLVRQHFVKAHQAIVSARELVRIAARLVDAELLSDIEVNTAKMAASEALCLASDSAMQLYGAEGISDLTPLAGIYRIARTTRILDGSDEALTSSVGRRLVDAYKDGGEYRFD
ncbi:MAG: acyl-CoA dehydrogenase [Methylococcaceae bacterium]|nr:acyl-CoA dehydrogenase [Methylococcaceae bacterium]